VADEPVRSFGGSRRGAKPPPGDEFPDRVVLPAMVLKPVELPVVLTIDEKMLDETVAAVRDVFHAAAREGIARALAELDQAMTAAADGDFEAVMPASAD
jgi:hypothetical protein